MIFTQSLQKIDEANPQEAIKKMANHIRYLQEQLEYTLLNLDSRNISEITVEKIVVNSSSEGLNISSFINLTGDNKESFTVGKKSNGFEFSLKGKGGTQVLYLDSSGELNITKSANLTIDGGAW